MRHRGTDQERASGEGNIKLICNTVPSALTRLIQPDARMRYTSKIKKYTPTCCASFTQTRILYYAEIWAIVSRMALCLCVCVCIDRVFKSAFNVVRTIAITAGHLVHTASVRTYTHKTHTQSPSDRATNPIRTHMFTILYI